MKWTQNKKTEFLKAVDECITAIKAFTFEDTLCDAEKKMPSKLKELTQKRTELSRCLNDAKECMLKRTPKRKNALQKKAYDDFMVFYRTFGADTVDWLNKGYQECCSRPEHNWANLQTAQGKLIEELSEYNSKKKEPPSPQRIGQLGGLIKRIAHRIQETYQTRLVNGFTKDDFEKAINSAVKSMEHFKLAIEAQEPEE